jgi:hypothetical protein
LKKVHLLDKKCTFLYKVHLLDKKCTF